MINKKFLLSVAAAAVIFTGCGDDKQSPATQTAVPVKTVESTTTEKVTATVNTVAKKVEEIAQEVQKEAPATIEAAVQKVEEVTKVVMETAPEVVKEKLAVAQQAVVEASAPVIEAVKEATAPAIDGAALYAKCAGCHGASAEKKALGKSKVIKGWTATQTAESLKGYKAGTYGGAMKGIMKSQVANMSDAQIDALSAYIATF